MLGHRKAVLTAGTVVLVMLGGCAQTGGTRPGTGTSASQPCSMGKASLIGGLVGAVLGKDDHRVAAAAIGAGIGAFACMAYNYHVRKVRDARAVEESYQHERGTLPASNTLADYQSELLPGDTVRAGNKATMQSHITVVRGTQSDAPQLKQQLTLLSPEGKELSTITKDAESIKGTGEYETNFVFNLPQGIQEGQYTVRSTLYMDGEPVGSNKIPMLVVT